MKKSIRRILSGLLCAGVLALGIPAPSRALTLTAVNDSILPLSDSTMPARLGGEIYVPYSVFSQLGVSASSSDGVLDLSANGETLSFSPAEGYVYDQNLNSYSTPAYSMNGTTYVPVKLCCGKFGLSYSTLAVAGETVLRVTDGSASSDSAFAAAKSGTIENTINSYKGIPSSNGSSSNGSSSNGASSNGGTAAKPDETPIPKVEEKPKRKPARVYLTFCGAPDKNTAAVLDTLSESGRTAAFFLPVKSADWTDDTVRRIAAEGHTLALLLDADEKASGDALVEQLTLANERLRLLTGVQTRIVSVSTGCAQLSRAQRDALIAAGYRLWDATLDAGDEKGTAVRAYAETAQRFSETDAAVVLRLHHSAATAEALSALSAYMTRQGIPSGTISLALTPINGADETR